MEVGQRVEGRNFCGGARSHTLNPPMIMSNSPPEAKSFRPVSMLFRNWNIFFFFFFSNRRSAGVNACPDNSVWTTQLIDFRSQRQRESRCSALDLNAQPPT